MPHTLPKPPKARKYVRLWNNRWHEGRMREVENLGYVEACKEKGIHVIDAKVSSCADNVTRCRVYLARGRIHFLNIIKFKPSFRTH